MKRLTLLAGIMLSVLLASCVSKKKYVALQTKYETSQSKLYELNAKNQEYADQLDKINDQVDNYYAKINSLKEENAKKLDLTAKGNVISDQARAAMRETLQNVDPAKLAGAKTLSDSIDLAVAYNLRKSLGADQDSSGIDINVDRTVVEITISDNLLFRSSSYRVSKKAYPLLEKIANLAKSEPAMEVLVEGHTDSRTFIEGSYIKDNWDLSVRRATAVVRILQNKYGVTGGQLIASGRSSYKPIADNSTKVGRQENRRTRIIILPNLDKFLALLQQQQA